MQTMKERDDQKPLAGIIQLDDAYWGGGGTERSASSHRYELERRQKRYAGNRAI